MSERSCSAGNATRLIIRHAWADAREPADAHRLTRGASESTSAETGDRRTFLRRQAPRPPLHPPPRPPRRFLPVPARAAQNIKKIALALKNKTLPKIDGVRQRSEAAFRRPSPSNAASR